jgi:hypothetical protein
MWENSSKPMMDLIQGGEDDESMATQDTVVENSSFILNMAASNYPETLNL